MEPISRNLFTEPIVGCQHFLVCTQPKPLLSIWLVKKRNKKNPDENQDFFVLNIFYSDEFVVVFSAGVVIPSSVVTAFGFGM